MPTPPDTPTPPNPANSTAAASPHAQSRASTAGTTPSAPAPPKGPPRLPSTRVAAAHTVVMLVIGISVGAAIGPGVGGADTTLAGERVRLLLPAIAALAGGGGSPATSTSAAVQPPPVTPQVTPTASSSNTGSGEAKPAATKAPPGAAATPAPAPSATKKPSKSTEKSVAKATLPPVTSVWLITLSGGTFAQALAQAAAAPYLDSQLVPTGTLLSGWSSLEAGSFASEAALLSGVPPQTLDSIVQPPCPEGAAGASCAPETAGALTAADEFLKATLPAITASAAYREHGLVVITFGAVGNATASSLPAGSATATLSSEPPVGVLLLSPFARAGARPTTTFNPTSPKQSLSGLLH
jgi:hypothetical protein